MRKEIHIVHLYPNEMNIYGDNGNILTLQRRLEWRDINVKITKVGVREKIPTDVDVVVAGGGQDSGQFDVEADLQRKKTQLNQYAKSGVTMLLVCGMYQLFGHRFITKDNRRLRGISVFDAYTVAGNDRMIGNVTIDTPWGELVGFENHSGATHLGAGQTRLGLVTKGNGNNSNTKDEGAVTNNVFGTYLHGPILPKNPRFADELLTRALTRKYGEANLLSLDDELEHTAFSSAIKLQK